MKYSDVILPSYVIHRLTQVFCKITFDDISYPPDPTTKFDPLTPIYLDFPFPLLPYDSIDLNSLGISDILTQDDIDIGELPYGILFVGKTPLELVPLNIKLPLTSGLYTYESSDTLFLFPDKSFHMEDPS